MAAISGIDPIAAPQHTGASAHDRNRSERAPVDFGGALSYREMVEAKLRVDPAALADKKRKAEPTRKREDPPRESVREQRLAEEDAQEPGSRLDISV